MTALDGEDRDQERPEAALPPFSSVCVAAVAPGWEPFASPVSLGVAQAGEVLGLDPEEDRRVHQEVVSLRKE